MFSGSRLSVNQSVRRSGAQTATYSSVKGGGGKVSGPRTQRASLRTDRAATRAGRGRDTAAATRSWREGPGTLLATREAEGRDTACYQSGSPAIQTESVARAWIPESGPCLTCRAGCPRLAVLCFMGPSPQFPPEHALGTHTLHCQRACNRPRDSPHSAGLAHLSAH